MRTLLLAASLALATQMSLGATINIGDVGYKTAFAASSAALYRTTLSISSSWTGSSSDWSTLASTGSTGIGYSRVRHCYTGTNLYMVAIDTSGALRIVTYSIDDAGSNVGAPQYVSSATFTGTHALSSMVSGVFCNKGKVFVVKNANNPTLYYHTNIASISSNTGFSSLSLTTGTGSCAGAGMTTSMTTHDIFVADGVLDTDFNAYISMGDSTRSIFKASLSQSSATMSFSSCKHQHNAGDGVTRMHVDTGLNRLYYYDARGTVYASGVLNGENDLKYVSTSSSTTTTTANTLATITANSGNNDCYDVFVSDDIVWVACQFDTAKSMRIKRVSNTSPTSSNNNFDNIGSGDLSTAAYSMQTISVYDPSSSAAVGPSVGVALCAVAALLGAQRAL